MLTVSDVSARLGDLLLFSNVNFSINPGDRIGLVGPNGAGKTTLLRILTGEIPATTGSVLRAPGMEIGYLRQGFSDIPAGTLADVLDVPAKGIFAANRALDDASAAFAEPDADVDSVSNRFQIATDFFESKGGYQLVAEIESLLDQFGLGDIPLDRSVGELSGGQKTRAGLAALLATRPDLLVLDEPTNHLDASALAWLQTFLTGYAGAFIIVSHDRAFLDQTVSEILAIDPRTQAVRRYVGNYTDFVHTREHEHAEASAGWHRQQLEVAKINRDIRAAEQKSRTIENSTIDFAIRKKAAKIARPAVVRKKKLEKLLASEDAAERPERSWGLSLDFGTPESGARDVVIVTDLCVQFGAKTILSQVDVVARHGERIAITGENGSGKTTLLKAISGDLEPSGGTVRTGPGVKIGYLSQEQETLDPALTVMQQASRTVSISETDVRNELHKFLFGGETVHKLIGDLSYGERARLMLALLVLRQTNVLLLDEPLNHLDIDAREQFEQALAQFGGTILMVLHDQYAIGRLATHEWRVANGTVTELARSREKV